MVSIRRGVTRRLPALNNLVIAIWGLKMWLGLWVRVTSYGVEIEGSPFAVVVWVVFSNWRFVMVMRDSLNFWVVFGLMGVG